MKSLVALTMTITKRRGDGVTLSDSSAAISTDPLSRLQTALDSDTRARKRLESELLQLTAKLSQTREEAKVAELNNVDLLGRCESLHVELKSAHEQVEALKTQLRGEQYSRRQNEEVLRELQAYQQALKEAKRMPGVQRAVEIRSRGGKREQIDELFAQVIALSELLEGERKCTAHLHSLVSSSESELNELRCRVKLLKQASRPAAPLSLLTPMERDEDPLRKVPKLTAGPRCRPTLLQPPQNV